MISFFIKFKSNRAFEDLKFRAYLYNHEILKENLFTPNICGINRYRILCSLICTSFLNLPQGSRFMVSFLTMECRYMVSILTKVCSFMVSIFKTDCRYVFSFAHRR